MTDTRILVVAATKRELALCTGCRTLTCGVGPVEASAATAAEIARHRPDAVLHVGIAGARRHLGLAPATLVIGTDARYCDLGVPEQWAPHVVAASALLLSAAQRVLPSAALLSIGTSGRIGGTVALIDRAACDIEAMEGFGVLRAAQLAGVPAIEIRSISNEIEEADRARWHFDEAFAAITAATPGLVAEFLRCVN